MRVLILGFDRVEEIDAAMEKLIAESGRYLFTVVCGGKDNAAYDYAIERGAPVEFSQATTPNNLIKEADYLVIKINENTPQWMKNLMMAWKKEGKHGTVIR